MGENDAYLRGVIEGLSMYAHWEDGVQYVGTTGVTLKEAIALCEKAWENGKSVVEAQEGVDYYEGCS